MSKCEQKWAQIEKNYWQLFLHVKGSIFFLYGREFTVESDHKPLETLIKRDIDDVTARLQRMFMLLLKYPSMNVVYKPGKDMLMLIADCLSRAQLHDIEEVDVLTGIIHSVTKTACVHRSEDNYNYYCELMRSDEKYNRIVNMLKMGGQDIINLMISVKFFTN